MTLERTGMVSNTRKERWQTGLDRTLRRLDERKRLDPQPMLTATRAYNDFKDHLMAAGYTRALEYPDQEVHAHLRLAAEATVKVFRWHSTTAREITHLPSFETEHFIDDSTINPETFVDAYYAMLAGGAEEQLEELCAEARDASLFIKKDVEPEAMAVAQALAHITSDKPDRWEQARAELSVAVNSTGRWNHEARCLILISRAAIDELADYLEEYRHWLDHIFVEAGRPDAPARLLALPILGLEALARRST